MKGIPMEQTVRQEFCGVVLAAGLSTRMGAFKPLVPLCGKPLIQNSIDHMLSGGATTVVVVVGFHATEMEALLSSAYGPEVQVVYNPQFATRDMMYSIQVGCAHLPPCDAFFLLPGDMPVIQPATFRLLIDAWRRRPGGVIFPTLEGYRKHPPLISSALIPPSGRSKGTGGSGSSGPRRTRSSGMWRWMTKGCGSMWTPRRITGDAGTGMRTNE
jgi:CTP:molybdopterin cytidylyltransferase MocA